uniref:TF-B3 domain-containing protein n=1 Tax=Triticum urartu TaxID=4572 RepID=A0A8R7P1W2_TRIUA
MLGMDNKAAITTSWSKFRSYANIHQGDIYAFCFKVTANRCLALA